MGEHAYLSASSSHRWLACPPSVKLCESLPDETSEFAKQGTDAHTLCAYLVEKAIGKDVADPRSSLSYLDSEMEDCASEYCSYVLESLENAKQYCKDPAIYIEQRLDFSRYVEKGFGTGDCLIIADKRLHIIDFKYGLGVKVEASANSQMMCYALGALEAFGDIYDIEEIEMSIFQPRIENISSSVISKADLLAWGEGILKPTAKLAYEGKGEFKSGSHCKFCKAKAVCRKRAEDNLENAKYDFKMPDTLSNLEIAAILETSDELTTWINDVKEYALQEALKGAKFEGFKLVEGRSNRKFIDETLAAKRLIEAGYEPYEKKLLSITSLTALLGKSKFNELLNDQIFKPTGKPVLVKESDKRPELNNAVNDFNDNKEEN